MARFDTTRRIKASPHFDVADGVLLRATIDRAAATTADLVAAATGVIVRVHRVVLSIGGANNLTFLSAAASLHGGVLTHPAAALWHLPFSPYPYFETVAGEALRLTTSTNAQVSGFIDYLLE